MFTKLNSSLQVKNKLGLSDEDLASLELDNYYHYLRSPGAVITSERGGSVQTLTGDVELNVERGRAVVCQPNPELHLYGTVSFNPIRTGQFVPEFTFKAFKAGEVTLDWLYEIRLVNG